MYVYRLMVVFCAPRASLLLLQTLACKKKRVFRFPERTGRPVLAAQTSRDLDPFRTTQIEQLPITGSIRPPSSSSSYFSYCGGGDVGVSGGSYLPLQQQ